MRAQREHFLHYLFEKNDEALDLIRDKLLK
jgi:hypothetical protein